MSDRHPGSAHVDTFVLDQLPMPAELPEVIFTLPELHYPARLNCGAALLDDMVAAGFGERRCLMDAAGVELSYAEVLQRANQIANVLVGPLGLVPGNRVLLLGPNNPELATCWLAVQKAGMVAVTAMPMLRAGELRVIVDRARVNLALGDSRFTGELEVALTASSDVGSGSPSVPIVTYGSASALAGLASRAGASFVNCPTASTDPALIAFTSGTTGQPKGCVHLHRDVLAIADTFSRHVIAMTADDLVAGSPPLAFTFGLGGMLVFPLRVGACALLLESAPPPALLEAIAKHRVTTVFTAPTAYRAMLDILPGADVSSLTTAVSAGEPLPLPTRHALERATGLRLIDGLGATEMLHVFISASGDDVRDGAIGRAVPGFEVKIVDDAGNEVPDMTVGRLAVRGPTGCRYLGDDRQKSYVRDGWNHTGDAMHRDRDGYFWYAARTDDMIVSSGYNIAAPEVEAAVLSHPGVAE